MNAGDADTKKDDAAEVATHLQGGASQNGDKRAAPSASMYEPPKSPLGPENEDMSL